MTRDECLRAIGAAFGNAPAWSAAGTWLCHVDGSPRREITLSPSVVNRNVLGAGIAPDQFTVLLQGIAAQRWLVRKPDGGPTIKLK
jgi:hypothetical protein